MPGLLKNRFKGSLEVRLERATDAFERKGIPYLKLQVIPRQVPLNLAVKPHAESCFTDLVKKCCLHR